MWGHLSLCTPNRDTWKHPSSRPGPEFWVMGMMLPSSYSFSSQGRTGCSRTIQSRVRTVREPSAEKLWYFLHLFTQVGPLMTISFRAEKQNKKR